MDRLERCREVNSLIEGYFCSITGDTTLSVKFDWSEIVWSLDILTSTFPNGYSSEDFEDFCNENNLNGLIIFNKTSTVTLSFTIKDFDYTWEAESKTKKDAGVPDDVFYKISEELKVL
jgi:hypothetical protein